MSILKLLCPPKDEEAVCLSQSTLEAGNLIINGNLANDWFLKDVSFIKNGYSQQISISSANDLSSAIFTISGTQNNSPVSTIIAGPNNNVVITDTFFDVVSSVSVNQAVENVSVGSGGISAFSFHPSSKYVKGMIYVDGVSNDNLPGCRFFIAGSLLDEISLTGFELTDDSMAHPYNVMMIEDKKAPQYYLSLTNSSVGIFQSMLIGIVDPIANVNIIISVQD